jgi:hypothetical protein
VVFKEKAMMTEIREFRAATQRVILKRLAKGPALEIELARAVGSDPLDRGFSRRAIRGHCRQLEQRGKCVGRRVTKNLYEWTLT